MHQPAPNIYALSYNAPLVQETPNGGLRKDMNINNPYPLCDLTLMPEVTVLPTYKGDNQQETVQNKEYKLILADCSHAELNFDTPA